MDLEFKVDFQVLFIFNLTILLNLLQADINVLTFQARSTATIERARSKHVVLLEKGAQDELQESKPN